VNNALLRVRRGDEGAIDDLVTSHQSGVYSYALSMVRDTRDAEEIAQDTFVRAIRAIRAQYTDDQLATLRVRPWLLKITRNLALNRLRSRKSRPLTEPIDDDLQIADGSMTMGAQESDEIDRLRRALTMLDQSSREWLELRFMNDLSYAEMVGVKGGTEAAARGKVFRALASLKQLCSEDENAEV
jgi:RNA polymerase sigma-70 factor (ECF subfamily)